MKLFLRLLSIKTVDFVDRKLFVRPLSIKMVDFVDRKLFLMLLSIKSGVFVDGNVIDKKETPSKGCLRNYLAMRCPTSVGHDVIAVLTGNLLLIQRSSNVNSASNCTTYHWVVTDSEESHHLNVCRN